MTRRDYQNEALSGFTLNELRMFALLWERQSGKSTIFADMSLFEMMRFVNRTIIYASASLLLGTEIILKQGQRIDTARNESLVEKESKVFSEFAENAAKEVGAAGLLFQQADAHTDKILKEKLKPDDYAKLFESQRLEFRVYHDRTRYSRTKVIAPNIATARSWSGTVFLDEVAFIRALKELITALLPVISTNKLFKLIYGTTPPEFNDTHYSFELLAPPSGTIFKPNAAGNWYDSESGVRVHRADAYDTWLAGKKIYDLKKGDEITPDEAFKRAPNKDGHRIAHLLWWMLGGAAACDMQRLKSAQERGVGKCQTFFIDDEADMGTALAWLEKNIDPKAKVGLGLDKATTTKEKSNPTVLSLLEDHGPDITVRCRFVWKTKDPDIANERIGRVLDLVANRPAGGRAKALSIDATNERYDAESQRKLFRKKVPVYLIVSSESVERPGLDKPTNWKEYLGDQWVGKLDDNNLTLPPDSYSFRDYRLVMKDRGKFVCEPNDEGMHGDCFDGDKLGLNSLVKKGENAVIKPAAVGNFQGRFR